MYPAGRLSPVRAYYLLTCGDALFYTLAVNVILIFQTTEAGLSPAQLLIVGAALQGMILVSEMPTGILADTYSRRLSVVIGMVLVGGGFLLSGAFARFETILLGHAVWGIGRTFVSGAQQAWIADEVGIEEANRVYLRSTQLTKLSWVIAIPLSTAIATYDLNLPVLIGGACFVGLGLLLAVAMTEAGFSRPARQESRRAWHELVETYRASNGLVRSSPLLLTMFCITAFYGMAGQGFERLWVAHFYENVGFPSTPDLDPVVWFGAVRMSAALLSIAAIEIVRRTRVESMSSHSGVARSLFTITAAQVFGILALALSGEFLLAAAAYCVSVSLSVAYDPFYLAWINQNVESRVRATVISMSSQADAMGRTAGGPVIGVVGSLVSLKAALVGAASALIPALMFYLRAFQQGGRSPAPALPSDEEQEIGPAEISFPR